MTYLELWGFCCVNFGVPLHCVSRRAFAASPRIGFVPQPVLWALSLCRFHCRDALKWLTYFELNLILMAYNQFPIPITLQLLYGNIFTDY